MFQCFEKYEEKNENRNTRNDGKEIMPKIRGAKHYSVFKCFGKCGEKKTEIHGMMEKK